jgi:hypothetical protein
MPPTTASPASGGRTVEAFFSDNHIEPDYAVEFFILEPQATDEATES